MALIPRALLQLLFLAALAAVLRPYLRSAAVPAGDRRGARSATRASA